MFKYTLNMFQKDVQTLRKHISPVCYDYVFGIPQGGLALAMELSRLTGIPLMSEAHFNGSRKRGTTILVVDDLIDSGETIKKYLDYDIMVLGVKGIKNIPDHPNQLITWGRTFPNEWVHFWWEPSENPTPQTHVTRLLEYIGEDPTREGLVETPARVIRSFEKLYGGYAEKPEDVMKTFTEGSCDEMVVLKDITIHSTCEHHMLPFSGVAHIAYIPNGKVLGVSKLARLLEIFARRLQIQERIGEQVTGALMEYLEPLGAACTIEARHACMTTRGVEQQTSTMVTSSLKGVFMEKPEVRAEYMQLIKR